jgi:hypothetical protein
LEFGHWNLVIVWSLGFGIWEFAIGISPLGFGYCLEIEIWSLGFPACPG